MKIVLLGRFKNSDYLTGPEKFSYQLHKNLLASSDVVLIDYFFKNAEDSSLLKQFFGKRTISKDPLIYRFGHIPLFLYLIKQKPDIMHILTAERYTILVFIYKFIIRRKIVTTFHSILKYEIPNTLVKKKEFKRYRDYLWEWLAIRYSDKLIFLSEYQKRLATRYYGTIDGGKIKLIPNGVESDFYNNDKKLNINNSLKIVFYNGNNDSIDRGLSEILKVLSQVNLPIQLYIIGDYSNISNYNFEFEIVKPMNKNDLKKFLLDKHILLKSITYDSFPIFSIECMAAGLIVIVSNIVGSSSYIENEKNGFVYDYNNPDKVKEILKDIFYKKYDLNKISSNAGKIINILNWNNIARQYLDTYNETI